MFKAVSGVDNNAASALDVYQNNTPTEEFQTVALNVTNQHKNHYMNRLATHSAWSSPSKVRKTPFHKSNPSLSHLRVQVVLKSLVFSFPFKFRVNRLSARS